MKLKRASIALTAILLAVPLMGMSCGRRGTRDAPIDQRLQDNQAPYIVNGPDRFHNLALKCVGDVLLITHTREAQPVAIEAPSVCNGSTEVPQVAAKRDEGAGK